MHKVTDTGEGWVAPAGFPKPGRYYFVAAYRLYLIRSIFTAPYLGYIKGQIRFPGPVGVNPLTALSWAYTLTGEERYAHKAIVMLNRLANVYRGLNGTVSANTDWRQTKWRAYVDDHNFENDVITNCAIAFELLLDAIRKDWNAARFFTGRGTLDLDSDGQVTPSDTALNIQRNLFGYMYEFVHRQLPLSRGNSRAWALRSLVTLATLFRNDLMIKEAVDGRYGVKRLVTNTFYRNGQFYEDSSNYGPSVTDAFVDIANLLAKYRGIKEYRHGIDVFGTFCGGIFERMLTWKSLISCDGRISDWGDAGNARLRVMPQGAAGESGEQDLIAGEQGLAILRMGDVPEWRKHLMLYHGLSGAGHGHLDQLMLKVVAYGWDLSGDIGYPSGWQSPKLAWERATASHNTVVVDEKDQLCGSSAGIDFYGKTSFAKAIAAYSRDVYEDTRVYHRTALLVEMSPLDHFVVDIFRVAGGQTRDYIFHSLSGEDGREFACEALENLPKLPATLAGPDVAYQSKMGPTYVSAGANQLKRVSHYSFITDIQGGRFDEGWNAVWFVDKLRNTGISIWMPGVQGRELFLGKAESYGAMGQSPLDSYIVVRERNSIKVGRGTLGGLDTGDEVVVSDVGVGDTIYIPDTVEIQR